MVQVPKSVLQTMTQLLLRHEDALNGLLQESQFVVHLTPGVGSIIPQMLKQTKDWHAQSEKTTTLRHCLAKSMISTLQLRLSKLAEASPTSDLYQDCMKYHLLKSEQDRTMPFLRWNAQQKKLQPTDQPGLPLEAVQKSLANIMRLMDDQRVTLRFHALARQKGEDSSHPVPFLWCVSMRNSPELWSEISTLCYHSIWQLIQARVKAQTLDRQPLAKQLMPKK